MNARLKHINPLGGLAMLNRRSHAQLEDEQTRDLALAFRMALTGMLTGHGTEQMWSTLACALNIAMLLAEAGVHPGHTYTQSLQIIKDAQQGLMRSAYFAQDSGEWKLGTNQLSIECAFRLHDDQIADATKGQIVCAMEEVHRRITVGETL